MNEMTQGVPSRKVTPSNPALRTYLQRTRVLSAGTLDLGLWTLDFFKIGERTSNSKPLFPAIFKMA